MTLDTGPSRIGPQIGVFLDCLRDAAEAFMSGVNTDTQFRHDVVMETTAFLEYLIKDYPQ